MREIDPIKSKRTKSIKEKSYLFRINSLGYPVLKNKQIGLKNHHYDVIKLPNQETDYSSWKKEVKKDLRIKDDDLIYFIENSKRYSLKELYENLLLEKDPPLSYQESFLLNLEIAIENMIGDSLATSLFKNNEASLKDFTFTRVYSSKNRHYIRDDLLMGAQVDSWGMMNGTSTLIEIQSLSYEDFELLKKNMEGEDLTLKDWNLESQKVLACEASFAFYKAQMKLLCTGFSQAVIYFVNRNTFDTMAFFIKKDKLCFQWLKKIDKSHKKVINYFSESKKEEWKSKFNIYFQKLFENKIELPYKECKSKLNQKKEKDLKKEQEELKNKPEKIEEKLKELKKLKEKTSSYQEKNKRLEKVLEKVLSPETDYKVGNFLAYLDSRNHLQMREITHKGENKK